MDSNNLENEVEVVDVKSAELSFIVLRIVFVVLIAASILFTKFLLSDTFKKIKYYYDNHISINVTAEYFFGDDNSQ